MWDEVLEIITSHQLNLANLLCFSVYFKKITGALHPLILAKSRSYLG